MTDGPMVRLAKAAQEHQHSAGCSLEPILADLAGPCKATGTIIGLGPCPWCNGTGTDPLAKAREADQRLIDTEIAAAHPDPDR